MWEILGFVAFIAYWQLTWLVKHFYKESCKRQNKNPDKGLKVIENASIACFIVLGILAFLIAALYSE